MIGAILGLALALACQDAPPADQAPRVSSGTWLERPSAEDFARHYPRRARRERVVGRAVIQCVIGSSGRMTECVVIEETPADYGFGAAAILIAASFRMATTTSDGTPTAGGTMTVPIRFTP